MKRILFVTPPYHCGVVEVAGSWPPLGLAYLAAQARKAGWSAEIYDAMTLRHELKDIAEHIRAEEYDVVATSAITPTYPAARDVLAVSREVRPEVVTLLGGVHPTFCYREIFDQDGEAVDYIIAGEGELALGRFLTGFDDPDKRHATPGLIFREGGEVRANPVPPLCDNLDSLDAAFDLLDWSLYHYYVIPGSILGAVSTSRGCNHGCTFCSQQKFWNQMWRGRDPKAVVSEIIHLNREYGVNVFLFTDEYPTREADRWEALLDRIIEADLGCYFLMETRVEDILRDERILPKYRRAGIIHVYVGAEATDQATLDKLNKEITVSQSRRAIELIAEHGMISETSFVLGFPHETRESIEQTFQLAREFNPDFAHFLAITPWPYSEFHREVAGSIAVHDYSRYNLIDPIIKPDAMSLDEVDLAIVDCYRRFYMPKMLEFRSRSDPFLRDYLLTSMKLIMKSSFLIGKFARLGLNPVAMMNRALRR